jgi:Leucine-rich repeat (LRR) protein
MAVYSVMDFPADGSIQMPPEIVILNDLQEIHITNIPTNLSVSDIQPEILEELEQFTFLDLSRNSFHDSSIPTYLGSFTNLKEFHMVDSKTSGPLPTELGMLLSLENLKLSDNEITGPLPSDWSAMDSVWNWI